jgi:hypothetical protein
MYLIFADIIMIGYTTREVAEKLNLSLITLDRYIAAKKIPVPALQRFGRSRLRVWNDADIERVRKILPKIANGRKTRYQKERAKKESQSKGSKKKGPRKAAKSN